MHQIPAAEHWLVVRVALAAAGFTAVQAVQETLHQLHQAKAVTEALLLLLHQMKAQVVAAVLQQLALLEQLPQVVTEEMERHHPFPVAVLLIVVVEQEVLITEEPLELVGLEVVEMQALLLLQIL